MRHRFTKVLLGAAALRAARRARPRLPRARTTRRPRTTSASSIHAPASSGRTAPRSSRASRTVSSTPRRAPARSTARRSTSPIDDQGVAATGVTEAKDLIGQGIKILMGTGSSGVACRSRGIAAQNQVLYISGPAAADAMTGINKYTFRAGRQTIQDVLDAKSFLGRRPARRSSSSTRTASSDTATTRPSRRSSPATTSRRSPCR